MSFESSRDTEWADLSAQLRNWCQRAFGYEPLAITFEGPAAALRHVQALVVPIPVAPIQPAGGPPERQGAPVQETNQWNTGLVPRCLPDCAKVYWPGLGTFSFTPTQRPIVKVLWEAWQDGTHEVSMRHLLASTQTDAVKLSTVFDRNPAWSRLIVATGRGFYRLAESPRAREEDPEELIREPSDPDG